MSDVIIIALIVSVISSSLSSMSSLGAVIFKFQPALMIQSMLITFFGGDSTLVQAQKKCPGSFIQSSSAMDYVTGKTACPSTNPSSGATTGSSIRYGSTTYTVERSGF